MLLQVHIEILKHKIEPFVAVYDILQSDRAEATERTRYCERRKTAMARAMQEAMLPLCRAAGE
jgi:hypothetical protein